MRIVPPILRREERIRTEQDYIKTYSRNKQPDIIDYGKGISTSGFSPWP